MSSFRPLSTRHPPHSPGDPTDDWMDARHDRFRNLCRYGPRRRGPATSGPVGDDQPVPAGLRVGRTPRGKGVGLHQRGGDRSGRKHLGRGALRREHLRRLGRGSHPPLRQGGEPAAELRRRHDRVAARHRRGSRGERLDQRCLGQRCHDHGALGAQVLPRGRAADDARHAGRGRRPAHAPHPPVGRPGRAQRPDLRGGLP